MTKKTLIQREILPELIRHLEKPEITLIVGPRQAGKTTLLKEMIKACKTQNRPTLLLNVDQEEGASLLRTQTTLIDRLKLAFGSEPGVVFIDEIQQKENAGKYLKGIYDMDLPYKFVVTGSGSLELKEKVHESLAGRKRVFEVKPLSFEEFANWKTEGKYANKLTELFAMEKFLADSLLEEYLAYGGYPRVVLEEKETDKQQALIEIYESFLIKDMQNLLRVKKLRDLRRLLKVLAGQTGQLLNEASLARDLEINARTLSNYLWYLEQTYIIHLLTPFSRSARHEVRRAPMAYFVDLGMRNNILGQARVPVAEQNHSWVFQSFVADLLRGQLHPAADFLHFWRTTTDAEVDFVFLKGEEIIPVEVKDSDIKKPTVSRSYRAFVDRYQPKRGYVVNRSLEQDLKLGDTTVHFVPWWKLINGFKE